MKWDIIGEFRNIKEDGELKGTCFLINSEYVVTADHVSNKIANIDDILINFKFIKKAHKVKKRIYSEYENIDFVIFQLEDEIEVEVQYKDIYITVPIEKGESWETVGYPAASNFKSIEDKNSYTYLAGYVNREIECEKYDYELNVNDQQDSARWGGLSGSPVIINDKIVGIISCEDITRRLKPKLKIISFQKIIEFLSNNAKDILECFSYKSKNLLNERIQIFKEECCEKFLFFKSMQNEIEIDCFFLKKGYESKDIIKMLDMFLKDYANKLESLILVEEGTLKEKRERERIVEKVTNELKSQLIKDKKISLVLLWIILEGKYEIPRLASTYSLINENLKQDIYVKNSEQGMKLLIGYAEMKEDMIDSLRNVLDEITTEKKKNYNRIMIWDELAISCLNIKDRVELQLVKESTVGNEKLEITLLHSYNSGIYNNTQYKDNGDNINLVESLVNYELGSRNEAIKGLCNQYSWVKETKINWILVPIESVDEFKNMVI